jgi:hypothetical protein
MRGRASFSKKNTPNAVRACSVGKIHSIRDPLGYRFKITMFKITADTKRIGSKVLRIASERSEDIISANNIPCTASDTIPTRMRRGFLGIRDIRIAQKSHFLNRCNISDDLQYQGSYTAKSIHNLI